tara:strand:- start:107 stop:1054 length:948 start_codon:yes stop_codon:yes gene_type:complete
MKKNILLIIISFLLLYFIIEFNNIDIAQFDIFRAETFLLVIFFTLILIILNTIRLYLISQRILKIKFIEYLYFSLTSFVFNVLSFSGTGELIKYYLLSYKLKKKDDIFSFFIIEKAYGLISILILTSTIFSFYFFGKTKFLFFLAFFLVFIFYVDKNNFFLKKIPYLNYFNFSFFDIYKDINKFLILLVSLLIHIIYILQLFLIMTLVYKNNSEFMITIILILTVLIMNSIPITYSGFGIREFSIILIGSFADFDKLGAVNSILSLGIYTFLIAVGVFLFLFLIFKINYKVDLLNTLFSKKIIKVRMKYVGKNQL